MKKFTTTILAAFLSFGSVAYAQGTATAPPAGEATARQTQGVSESAGAPGQEVRNIEMQIKALRQEMEQKIKAIREEYRQKIAALRGQIKSDLEAAKQARAEARAKAKAERGKVQAERRAALKKARAEREKVQAERRAALKKARAERKDALKKTRAARRARESAAAGQDESASPTSSGAATNPAPSAPVPAVGQ